MPLVDEAVVDTLLEQVFAPDRLIDLVSGYLEAPKADAQWRRSQTGHLKAELTETEGAISRVVGMVEAGLLELDDPALRDRLRTLKAKRTDLQSQIDNSTSAIQQPQRLTEAKLNKLSTAVRAGLRDAPAEMRKAYVKLFVDKVIVSPTEIHISGPKGALASAATIPFQSGLKNLILLFEHGVPLPPRTRPWDRQPPSGSANSSLTPSRRRGTSRWRWTCGTAARAALDF